MAAKSLTAAELRRTATAYNKAKGNISGAAMAIRVGRSTFQSRVRMVQERHPEWLKKFEAAKGGIPLLDEQAEAAWNTFQESDFNYVTGAGALNMHEGTFRKRVAVYASRHGIDLSKLRATTTLAQDVERHRTRQSDESGRAKLKDAAARIAQLEDQIKELEWAAKASFEPAEWTLPAHVKRKREHMPYLLTSDFQIGEVIRAEE